MKEFEIVDEPDQSGESQSGENTIRHTMCEILSNPLCLRYNLTYYMHAMYIEYIHCTSISIARRCFLSYALQMCNTI